MKATLCHDKLGKSGLLIEYADGEESQTETGRSPNWVAIETCWDDVEDVSELRTDESEAHVCDAGAPVLVGVPLDFGYLEVSVGLGFAPEVSDLSFLQDEQILFKSRLWQSLTRLPSRKPRPLALRWFAANVTAMVLLLGFINYLVADRGAAEVSESDHQARQGNTYLPGFKGFDTARDSVAPGWHGKPALTTLLDHTMIVEDANGMASNSRNGIGVQSSSGD
jgi:hypothetical protein